MHQLRLIHRMQLSGAEIGWSLFVIFYLIFLAFPRLNNTLEMSVISIIIGTGIEIPRPEPNRI